MAMDASVSARPSGILECFSAMLGSIDEVIGPGSRHQQSGRH
jgi:hypothetical protein